MRIIIGGQYYATLDGSSVKMQRSATDPVPTCQLNLIDNTSALSIHCPQELLVLDDQVIPNSTVNLVQNPDLAPIYTTAWFYNSVPGGMTVTQASPGVTFALANVANSTTFGGYQYTLVGTLVPGQTYTFSFYVQASSPVGFQVGALVRCRDQADNILTTTTYPNFTPPTSQTRYSFQVTATANTSFAEFYFYIVTTSGTNSGSATFTHMQCEPNWFPTQSYPTPYCGPSQTNCQQLPLGFWIRQYRKFAGLVTNVWPQGYIGNKRTIQVSASGYAWLLSTIVCNDSFSTAYDSAIMTTLANKYLIFANHLNGYLNDLPATIDLCTTTNVVQGVQISSLQSNWDDLRSIYDSLAGMSGFYWTIDSYWNLIYAAPGYISQGIGLIGDNSSQPDNVTTFPVYNFSAEEDFTQPGSTILVIGGTSGSTTYTAEVVDPSQPANLGILSGYMLPTGSSWMRKVTDSAILSNADCAQRGLAELLQYDKSRYIYHATTNVELIPGESVQVTSATEGLSAATLLVQQTSARWLGTNSSGIDVWEYQSDLGAINRSATKIISRIFRTTQKGTSAPAIGLTQLSVIESLNAAESVGTSGTLISNYAQSILPDTPLGLWPFGEITGTIADDISGNAIQGTLNGGITQGAANLLTDPADSGATSFTFNGSTGYVSIPTSSLHSGNGAWSFETWCQFASNPAGNAVLWAIGSAANNQVAWMGINSSGHGTLQLPNTVGTVITTASALTTGAPHYLGASWDGTTLTFVVDGVTIGTATPGALNISYGTARIGCYVNGTSFWAGQIQYPAIYNIALSAIQMGNHHTAGT